MQPVWPTLCKVHERAMNDRHAHEDVILRRNVKDLINHIGKSHLKPALAILSRDMKRDRAAQFFGKTRQYLNDCHRKTYDPMESRLMTEQYTPGTQRQHVSELESQVTNEVIRERVLGSKSGDMTADTFYRYYF